MSAPRAAAQLLRMPMSLGYSFRPLLRGRGRRSAPSLPPTGCSGFGACEIFRLCVYSCSFVVRPLLRTGRVIGISCLGLLRSLVLGIWDFSPSVLPQKIAPLQELRPPDG